MFSLAQFVEPYAWLALIYAMLALHASYALHSLYVEVLQYLLNYRFYLHEYFTVDSSKHKEVIRDRDYCGLYHALVISTP